MKVSSSRSPGLTRQVGSRPVTRTSQVTVTNPTSRGRRSCAERLGEQVVGGPQPGELIAVHSFVADGPGERFRDAVVRVPSAHESIRAVHATGAAWSVAALQVAAVPGARARSERATRPVRLVGPHPLLLDPHPSRNRRLGGRVRLLPPDPAPRRHQHGGGAPHALEAGPPTVVGDGMTNEPRTPATARRRRAALGLGPLDLEDGRWEPTVG